MSRLDKPIIKFEELQKAVDALNALEIANCSELKLDDFFTDKDQSESYRKRYKKYAQQAHPDKGGDEAQFGFVTALVDVLNKLNTPEKDEIRVAFQQWRGVTPPSEEKAIASTPRQMIYDSALMKTKLLASLPYEEDCKRVAEYYAARDRFRYKRDKIWDGPAYFEIIVAHDLVKMPDLSVFQLDIGKEDMEAVVTVQDGDELSGAIPLLHKSVTFTRWLLDCKQSASVSDTLKTLLENPQIVANMRWCYLCGDLSFVDQPPTVFNNKCQNNPDALKIFDRPRFGSVNHFKLDAEIQFLSQFDALVTRIPQSLVSVFNDMKDTLRDWFYANKLDFDKLTDFASDEKSIDQNDKMELLKIIAHMRAAVFGNTALFNEFLALTAAADSGFYAQTGFTLSEKFLAFLWTNNRPLSVYKEALLHQVADANLAALKTTLLKDVFNTYKTDWVLSSQQFSCVLEMFHPTILQVVCDIQKSPEEAIPQKTQLATRQLKISDENEQKKISEKIQTIELVPLKVSCSVQRGFKQAFSQHNSKQLMPLILRTVQLGINSVVDSDGAKGRRHSARYAGRSTAGVLFLFLLFIPYFASSNFKNAYDKLFFNTRTQNVILSVGQKIESVIKSAAPAA